jgi:hypothetical protein
MDFVTNLQAHLHAHKTHTCPQAVSGTCYPVGLAGLSLGGGIGLLSREHGLACDQIVVSE